MSKQAQPEDFAQGLYGLPHMGEVIAHHRLKAGWTSQETFAIVCGVDKQTVAYWENQKYLADMERRIFLSKLLKIPPFLLGLTTLSIRYDDPSNQKELFTSSFAEMLQENAYGLYEDILTFAHTSKEKYSPASTYRFRKHHQELEHIVQNAPTQEKDAWKDLLSRFYQHLTFIYQHQKNDEKAFLCSNEAVSLAASLHDGELLGAALYRRSRVHLIQNRHQSAKDDIESTLSITKRSGSVLKGSSYLLAAEISALYAGRDEKLKTQCRVWQESAAKLLYGSKREEEETFLTFNLYAVHHERAKTLLRFALFYTSDQDLLDTLQNTSRKANKILLADARNALIAARRHLESGDLTKEMYLALTEARGYLIAREFEESARVATTALQFSQKAHSQQGKEEVKQLYSFLSQLASTNPYIAHLGVELQMFPLTHEKDNQ